jgi:hypothetical protein
MPWSLIRELNGKVMPTQSLHSPGLRVTSLPETWMSRLSLLSGTVSVIGIVM